MVAADSSGNFYTAGGANNHVLVVKTDPSGHVLYSRSFGGSSGYDGPSAIAVDSTGAAYITGYTTAPDFPVINGYLTKGNLFLTKLSPDGSTIVYSTFIATQGGAIAVAVDASGSATSLEILRGPDLPTTPGAFMTSAERPMYQQSVFVVKVAPDGSGPVWATFIRGKEWPAPLSRSDLPGAHTRNAFIPAEYDTGRARAVDPAGNVTSPAPPIPRPSPSPPASSSRSTLIPTAPPTTDSFPAEFRRIIAVVLHLHRNAEWSPTQALAVDSRATRSPAARPAAVFQ